MMKTCGACGVAKPMDEFYRNRHRKDGLQRRCKPCISAYNLARKRADPVRVWEQGIRYRYGLDRDAFDALLAEQGGVCAGCGGPPVGPGWTFRIDHDHRTLVVRGLLCQNCNVAIGVAQDDPELLRRLADYLENPPAAKAKIVAVKGRRSLVASANGAARVVEMT